MIVIVTERVGGSKSDIASPVAVVDVGVPVAASTYGVGDGGSCRNNKKNNKRKKAAHSSADHNYYNII